MKYIHRLFQLELVSHKFYQVVKRSIEAIKQAVVNEGKVIRPSKVTIIVSCIKIPTHLMYRKLFYYYDCNKLTVRKKNCL